MIPKIEQEDGYWYVSVNGERLGKFKSRPAAREASDSLVQQAFVKGWDAVLKARRKRLSTKRPSMSHDGS